MALRFKVLRFFFSPASSVFPLKGALFFVSGKNRMIVRKSITGKIYSHFPKKESVLSITYGTDKIFHTVYDKYSGPRFLDSGLRC